MVRSPVALLAFVAALALGGRATPVDAAADDEARTEHIVVRGNVGADSIRAWARLAEAAYPQWKAFFGVEPPKNRLPLELDVRVDREEFLHAIHAVSKVHLLRALPPPFALLQTLLTRIIIILLTKIMACLTDIFDSTT